MKTMRILAASLAVTLVSLVATQSAEALTIALVSGPDLVIVTDGGPGDSAALSGVVATSATVGAFEVVLTAGFSDPIFGSSSNPTMLYNIEAFSSTGGTLQAYLTDDSFAATGTTVSASLATPPPLNLIGLPLATSGVTYNTYYAASNAEFDLDVLLTSQAATGFAAGVLPDGTGPYSLTQEIIITTTTAGVATASATLSVPAVAVPDGGLALSLLGFAMVGVEGLRRKLKK